LTIVYLYEQNTNSTVYLLILEEETSSTPSSREMNAVNGSFDVTTVSEPMPVEEYQNCELDHNKKHDDLERNIDSKKNSNISLNTIDNDMSISINRKESNYLFDNSRSGNVINTTKKTNESFS
jgi:hypothetical protein